MTRNPHLEPQLDAFAALSAPGFALMIDAPWGAGKTHALKRWQAKQDYLYISLYGVRSRDEIERAIFLARLKIVDNATTRAVTSLLGAGVETIASLCKIKNQLKISDLGQVALPKVLVFDDLERTEMSVNELLSALNRYVEHEDRNVILIANQAELRRRSPEIYDTTREKVIGRCITIVPDIDDALDAFLHTMNKAPTLADAHNFLFDEREVLLSVFLKSESNNLRLLRQAILEFSRFLPQVPMGIRNNKEGMQYLLGTFIVLSIAYHGDDGFGKDGLKQERDIQRSLWEVRGRKGKEPPETRLEMLQKKFQDHPHAELYGSVISGRLASEWIGRGYATDDIVASELENAAYFRIQHAEAWQTLWYWMKRPAESVSAAIEHLKKQMAAREILDPAVIMHVTGILLDLGDNGLGWASRAIAVQAMKDYIASLEEAGMLPPDRPKGQWRSPIIEESAFGLGFIQRDTNDYKEIHELFLAALDRAFWQKNAERATKLLELVKKDATDFAAVIDNEGRRSDLPNYADVPVLAGLNVDEAARIIFGLPIEATDVALSPFKGRWKRVEHARREVAGSGWPDEQDWMRRFKTVAEAIASKEEPIHAAQIRKIILRKLSFIDESVTPESSESVE